RPTLQDRAQLPQAPAIPQVLLLTGIAGEVENALLDQGPGYARVLIVPRLPGGDVLEVRAAQGLRFKLVAGGLTEGPLLVLVGAPRGEAQETLALHRGRRRNAQDVEDGGRDVHQLHGG